MIGKIKLPALQIFMTAVDVVEFSKILKDQIESVKFIKQFPWPDLNIPISDVLNIGNRGRLRINLRHVFFAWPDAAKKFNGEDGHYLTNHAFAYFVSKDV
ncbi:hypothetical protein SASC598O11_007570 [Snodgrassella alvi SCGC AB-598-O11]|nr:hypothetical protein SASC598O11_007570 [Snodgrassella alvi SCGC AB-598-O11]